MPSQGRLAAKSEKTRAELVVAARGLFAQRGYQDTTIEDIVVAAGVTRGALYHHFNGKDALFQAVYETVEADLAQRSLAAATAREEPVERLRAGIDAFLDACLEPDVQRIVLVDGVSVLGWEAWHDVGTRYSFGLLVAGLAALAQAGAIRNHSIEPLAHLIQGALVRAGMVLARAADPAMARADLGAELDALLAGLVGSDR